MRAVLLLLLLCLPLLGGCKKDEPKPVAEPKPQVEPPPPPPEPVKEAPASQPEQKQEDAKAVPEEIGVPECDEYRAKYVACLKEKVPSGTRIAMERQLEATWQEWQKGAKQPGGKRQLAKACQTAAAAAAASMKAFGCKW